MEHTFAKLTLKTIDADQRIIEGWASTNAVDRQGDVVEPSGAEFDLIERPIPLLLDHNHSEVIGEIEAAEVTPKGVRFRARVFKVDVPGAAKDYLDKAWQMLKAGARKFVSIGFRPLDWVALPSGGARFLAWEWLELSACAVPANPDAKITGLKRASSGVRQVKVGKPAHRVVKFTRKELLIAKWKVEADRRAAARKRLGIPCRPVKIHSVDLMLAREHTRREQRASKPFKIRTIHRTTR